MAFRPSGNIQEGKNYFSSKNKLYRYIVEVSFNSMGWPCAVSSVIRAQHLIWKLCSELVTFIESFSQASRRAQPYRLGSSLCGFPQPLGFTRRQRLPRQCPISTCDSLHQKATEPAVIANRRAIKSQIFLWPYNNWECFWKSMRFVVSAGEEMALVWWQLWQGLSYLSRANWHAQSLASASARWSGSVPQNAEPYLRNPGNTCGAAQNHAWAVQTES